MLQTPIPKLVTSMALPTVAIQLITVVYNTADTYFVSQLSTSASAAVGVVFSLMSIIQACGYGMSVGANSLISRRLGAKLDEEACMFGNSALFAAALVGALITIAGLSNLTPLMRLLGSTETMLPYSRSYAFYILLGAPVMCAAFALNNILRSEGEAVFSMWALCAGGLLNVLLDPLLIFTFGMGIAGAAIATVFSQTVSLILLLIPFLRGKSIITLGLRWISRRPGDYWLLYRTGLPTFCRQSLASVASALLNRGAGIYGDAAVAAITIATKVYLLIRNIVLGIGHGLQPVAGYNFGAGRNDRVRAAFLFACELGTAICCVSAALISLNAGMLVGWFRNDPDVIRIGTLALYFACALMPLMPYSTYVNQLYQCLGFSAKATFLASCRQGIFFIPLVFALPRLLGLTGIQMVQPASDLLTFLISIPFQIAFFKKVLVLDGNKKGREKKSGGEPAGNSSV